MRGETARKIKVEECKVEVFDVGTLSLCMVMCSLRVTGRAMGVEVSHEDVVTTGIEVMVKSGREIWWAGEVRGDVDVNHVMDVDEDLVDDGCAALVLQLSVQLFAAIVGRKQLNTELN